VGVYLSSGKKNVQYGPGPKGVPILGNAADLPKTDDYKVYASWAKKYGPSRVFLAFFYSYILNRRFYLLDGVGSTHLPH